MLIICGTSLCYVAPPMPTSAQTIVLWHKRRLKSYGSSRTVSSTNNNSAESVHARKILITSCSELLKTRPTESVKAFLVTNYNVITRCMFMVCLCSRLDINICGSIRSVRVIYLSSIFCTPGLHNKIPA